MDVQRSTATVRRRSRLTNHSPAPQTVESHLALPVVGEVPTVAAGGAALALVAVVLLAGGDSDGAPTVNIS